MAVGDGQEAKNYFYRNQVYPDAKTLLSWEPKGIEAIKSSGIIVPDTNTLLIPYGTSGKDLHEISNVFQQLKTAKRLFAPGQVIREFADNRSAKLAELVQQLTDKQSKVPESSRYPLLSSLPEFAEFVTAEQELAGAAKNYNNARSTLIDIVKQWYWNDPVSTLYRTIFDENAVVDPKFDESDTIREHEQRVAQKLPPGYKDAAKDDGGIGDYLIWKTILEIGKSHHKDVIFVSGEMKADWWDRSKGGPLYPRFELIDEFRRATSGGSFHIITFHRLLTMLGVDAAIVTQVKQQEELAGVLEHYSQHKTPGLRGLKLNRTGIENAVQKWILKHLPSVSRIKSALGSDFVGVSANGKQLLFTIREYYPPANAFIDEIRSWVGSFVSERKKQSSIYVIVCPDMDSLTEVQAVVPTSPFVYPSIICGVITNNEFVPYEFSGPPDVITGEFEGLL